MKTAKITITKTLEPLWGISDLLEDFPEFSDYQREILLLLDEDKCSLLNNAEYEIEIVEIEEQC